MGLRMRQVERASKDMTELVMQGHAHRSKADATEPGPIKGVAASRPILRGLP
jgi:hypothetical protein